MKMTDTKIGATLGEHQAACVVLLDELDRVCKALGIPYILFAGTLLGAVRHKGFIPWDDDLDVLMLRRDYDRFLAEAESVLDRETFYLQKEFSEHWPMFFSKLRLNNTACLETYHAKDEKEHHGVYIDIFPCDNAADNSIGRKIQFYASKVVIAKALDKRGYETDSKRKKAFMAVCKLLPMTPFLKLVRGKKGDGRYLHSFLGSASSFSKNVYPRKALTPCVKAVFEGKEYPISQNYDELLHIIYGDYMTLPPPEERVCKKHAILVDLHRSYEEYSDYHKNMVFEMTTKSIR